MEIKQKEIKAKVLEIIGDSDYGLELNDEFKREIVRRLHRKVKRIPHEEVVKKFG